VIEARVSAVLPNGLYEVELDGGRTLVAHLAGKMRMNVVRLIQGDEVMVEVAELDARKARIVGKRA
jgi:translation initiation factor IF-1